MTVVVLYTGPEVGIGGRYMGNADTNGGGETGKSLATPKSSGMENLNLGITSVHFLQS
jgi:hypothetical protein